MPITHLICPWMPGLSRLKADSQVDLRTFTYRYVSDRQICQRSRFPAKRTRKSGVFSHKAVEGDPARLGIAGGGNGSTGCGSKISFGERIVELSAMRS